VRVALISDIHGHQIALELVLAEIDREAVDLIVCLGDVATLGPRPLECIQLLRSRAIRSVLGNHDAFLLQPDLIEQYAPPPLVARAVDWCRTELHDDDLTWLQTFELELDVPMGPAGTVRLFHGSPRSHMEVILATTPADELDEMLAGRSGAVLAGGHTHVQMLRQHRGQLVLNVGAVGMPFLEDFRSASQRNEAPRIMPHAEYTILSLDRGRIQADLRRVALRDGSSRNAVLQSQMPMREMFAAQYL
jgi:predicted phosphodiesterase